MKKAVPESEPAANKMRGRQSPRWMANLEKDICRWYPSYDQRDAAASILCEFGAVEESIIMVDRTTGRSEVSALSHLKKKKRWIRHSCKGIGFTISPLRSSEQRGVGL